MREAVVIVMVGLPARGKSFISHSLVRFLRLIDVHVKDFNAGNLRRDTGSAGGAGAKAEYFSAANTAAKEERERLAMQCCDMMLEWIYSVPVDVSCVAILDATNTTRARRRHVLERCRTAAARAAAVAGSNPPPLRVVFLESICDDPALLEGNYRMKLQNDDYKSAADKEQALEDFRKRVDAYVEQYELLCDEEVVDVPPCREDEECMEVCTGLVRIINGGQKLSSCATGCSLVMLNISVLLSCFHLTHRRIILVPESEIDAPSVAVLLRSAEREDENSRPVDLLCGASRRAVRLARQVEQILNAETGPSSTGSNLAEEGLRQPRGILSLRNLEPRLTPSRGCGPGCSDEVSEESFFDLVDRMKEVIYIVERLPRSLVLLYPEEEVLRVLLAHFLGCPEDVHPSSMPLPEGPICELRRDHKGFALHEHPLPSVSIS